MLAPPQAVPFATTKNLILRAYREPDSVHLFQLYNDEHVAKPAIGVDFVVPHGENKWKQFIERLTDELVHLIIEVKAEYDEGKAGELSEEERWVGHISLSVRAQKNRDGIFGIALTPRWWGKSFGTEAVEWLVKYAFEQMGLHRVSLGVIGNNTRAIDLYKKVGFVEEGRVRESIWQDGEWVDGIRMGILEREYWERKRGRTT